MENINLLVREGKDSSPSAQISLNSSVSYESNERTVRVGGHSVNQQNFESLEQKYALVLSTTQEQRVQLEHKAYIVAFDNTNSTATGIAVMVNAEI